MTCDDVRKALEAHGLLLMQDKVLPSVAGLITGESLSSSWWSHPKGQEIFRCLDLLSDDPDVLTTRLIGGKVTFVHRSLWRPFLSIATANEPWQTRGLSAPARALLKSVPTMAKGPAVRELQERLLVRAMEVHTEAGRHEIRVDAWPRVKRAMPAEAARAEIERAAAAIGALPRTLPWNRL